MLFVTQVDFPTSEAYVWLGADSKPRIWDKKKKKYALKAPEVRNKEFYP